MSTCRSTNHNARCCPKSFRPSSCLYRCAAGRGHSGRLITMISTFPHTTNLWRSYATSIATLSVEGWLRIRRIGSGRAFGITRRASRGLSRLNRIGQRSEEAGNCPSGWAIENPHPPRSPKARDRGHPQLDKIPLRPGPPARSFISPGLARKVLKSSSRADHFNP